MQWQYIALAAFVVFFASMTKIMYRTVEALRKCEAKLEHHRPLITIGRTINASTNPRDADSEVDVNLALGFRNGGDRPAHQICGRIGHAPAKHPNLFQAQRQLDTPIRIDPGVEFVFSMKITRKFVRQEDGRRGVAGTDTLVYCNLQYSDSPVGGQSYEDEWWFRYSLDAPALSPASNADKQILEPYVRAVFDGTTA
ncbi:hypothetical protein ACFLST_00025 [Chloroflexota bacterium]